MQNNHIHHHHHKTKSIHRQKSWLKRFFSGRLLMILGLIFILVGLYYSISSNNGFNIIYLKILNYFKPSTTQSTIIMGSGFGVLLLYFLPASLIILLSGIYAQKFRKITYPLSFVLSIYLIGIQIYIYINFFNFGYYFLNFFIATVYLLLPALFILISGYKHEKPALIILSCFYFYISAVLYAALYSVYYLNFLFFYIILFSALIAWFGGKIKFPFINILNAFFGICFFSLVFLRKFVINSKDEFLINYIIFAALLYLVFYSILLYQSNQKDQPVRKWMQLAYSWSNLLFFFFTISFILLKYYSVSSLLIFDITLLLFNVVALFLLIKYHPTAWLLPNYYSILFLASMLLPLIFHENRAFLFMAVLSVGLLVYADEFKERTSLWLSRLALALTIGLYSFTFLYSYLPVAIFATRLVPNGNLLWSGVLSSVVMSLVIFVTNWQQSNIKETNPSKWFNGKSYQQFIYLLLLISLFITLGWIVFALICLLSGSVIHSAIGWFISGSLFFIIQIHKYAGNKLEFKKPLLYLAFLYVLAYPIFLGWDIFSENFIHYGAFNSISIVLHYLGICLLVVLSTMVIKRIYHRNLKNLTLKQVLQIITVVYLAFFLCIEYDNLTILISSLAFGSNPAFIPEIKSMAFNKYIPYSIILCGLSSAVFIYATYIRRQYLKTFSIILFTGTIIKLFVFDFPMLEQGGRSIVFYVLGAFLIGFALVYQKLPQTTKVKESRTRQPFRELGKKEEPVGPEKS